MKMFYATREKYPATRVDLHDLFSKRVGPLLNATMDWHMQSMASQTKETKVTLNPQESVLLGASSARAGWMGKAANQLLALKHDCLAWKHIRSGRYDIIQVRDKFWIALIVLWALRGQSGAFFFWMSFPYPEADLYRITHEKHAYSFLKRLFYYCRGKWTHALLYKIILPRADFIFVQSERMLDDVAHEGIERTKMIAVPMGIAWDRLSHLPPAKKLGLANDAQVAVYMGTMVKVRRLDFILEAFSHVLIKNKNAVLLMVGGENDDVLALKGIAKQLGISSSVIFTGLVPMEEAWSYVLAADICLSPFKPSPILDSTSPTKVVEYLALAKPVVVNDHPDQSQVIQESGAGIITPYSPELFAQGILELFNKTPQQIHQMGLKGREYVQNVRNYDIIAKNVACSYEKTLLSRRY